MGLIKKMTLHTNHRGVELEVGRKRIISHRDENNKRWIIEMFLRDPDAELSAKKEEEHEQKERAKNRINQIVEKALLQGVPAAAAAGIKLNPSFPAACTSEKIPIGSQTCERSECAAASRSLFKREPNEVGLV